MKHKFAFLTLALTLAFGFSSCIQSEFTVTVKKDGSGTIESKTVMGAALMGMMAGLGQQLGGGDPNAAPPAIPDNPLMQGEEAFAKQAAEFGEGVQFVGVEEVKTADGGVGVLAKYSFDDIKKVELLPDSAFAAMENMQNMGGAGAAVDEPAADDEEKEDPVTFDFAPGSFGGPAKLTINMPQPEPGETAIEADGEPTETPNPQEMAMAAQFLNGMRFAIVVRVDGEVTNSTASYQEGADATLLSMEMGQMLKDPKNFAKMQALEGEEDFNKVKDALKDIDGMKFETEEKLEIDFK